MINLRYVALDVEVHVALSDCGAPELTKGCPWIAGTYSIAMRDFADPNQTPAAVAGLPQQWDYIVDDDYIGIKNEVLDPTFDPPRVLAMRDSLVRYFELTSTTLTARLGRGVIDQPLRLPEGIGYLPQAQVAFSVPAENRAFAERYAYDGPAVGVLLGGAAEYYRYPEVSSWIKIIRALHDAFPGIRFYLTGIREPVGDRTFTKGYTNQAIEEVLASCPGIVDCYDIGLWNQIALLERCDVFLSPHTGFGFLASCVGTRWLTISGGHWPEYFFNKVPFYSVFPDDPEYPYRMKVYPKGSTSKFPCMRPELLDRKIPEIEAALGLLLSDDFTYEAAVARHRDNIAAANIDRRYVPQPGDPTLASF